VPELLDDRTTAYVLQVRPHFEGLRDVAAQLAGLLVLAATGARSAAPDHPMLQSAGALCEQSRDGIRSARATRRAGAHHRHLARAADSLASALSAAQDRLGRPLPATDLDIVLTPLKEGYAHLERASRTLPGFETVSFDHACCAGVGNRVPHLHPAGDAQPDLHSTSDSGT
jgi:hypothetical protein